MATLINLASEGLLFRLDPILSADEQEHRIIYSSPDLATWIGSVLPTLLSSTGIQETPLEQLDAFVANYASGRVLMPNWRFHPVKHLGSSVWELKTQDVRVFGWFPHMDCFVGVTAETRELVKKKGPDGRKQYPNFRERVVSFRNCLPLDEPKFIPGEDPNAVVSNYALSK